jgi:thiamine biosynthesis lipoprotein
MNLEQTHSDFVHAFTAMASTCEVRIETSDLSIASKLATSAENEARRIERKFSRYAEDSVLSAINRSAGGSILVDDETATLLDYADQCWRLSDGRFDITSGVLRRLWTFNGADRVPTVGQVDALLPFIGWSKVGWRRPQLTLPSGMELDLGGIGKEYAVDAALLKIAAEGAASALVNFGGDLRVTGPRDNGERWRIAIESVDAENESEGILEIANGALATSGDSKRVVLQDGVRFSHILDPRTGWPVRNPPRSVTVAAATCMEAGIMSTLAMLHGRNAERFLKSEGIPAWIIR